MEEKTDYNSIIKVPKLKKKKFLTDPNMVHEISHQPDFFEKKSIEKKSFFDDRLQVDDFFLKKSSSFDIITFIIYFIVLLFGVYIVFNFAPKIGALVFGGFFILLGLFKITLEFTRPNKDFILDRKNSIIKYPNGLWYKPIITYFKYSSIVLLHKGKYQTPVLQALPYGFLAYPYTIVSFHPNLFWSFMVWYMDKNRPLPPGDIFDAYREKDFERRKAAGFPPPLYYSTGIITPEATPEQQAEREHYWKDYEYFTPPIKRPEDSEIYNKQIHENWSESIFNQEGIISINTWHEITFTNSGKIIYMLSDENGKGYLPPEDEKYNIVSLALKKAWY